MSKYYSSSIAFGANQTKTERVVVSPTKIGDVTTDAVSGALTVDEVPTLDSLNPVSSDGVARAVILAGAELPTRGSSDTGKVLTVKNSAGDLEWDELPTVDQTYDASSENAQSGTAVAGAISGKQDTISDLATIRSGASAGATAVQPSSLAAVATSGSYNDLLNKPTIPAAVTVDQSYSASSTNAQSGTAVAGAISAVKQVPATAAADANKVLTVNAQGNGYDWVAPAQTTYTAGVGVDITAGVVSADIDGVTIKQATTQSTLQSETNIRQSQSGGYGVIRLSNDVTSKLGSGSSFVGKTMTIHIPGNTFRHLSSGDYTSQSNVYLELNKNTYEFGNTRSTSMYGTPLVTAYNATDDYTYIAEQDFVVSCNMGEWVNLASLDPAAESGTYYFGFGESSSLSPSSQLYVTVNGSSSIASPVVISETVTSNKIAVANPIPAYDTTTDAGKALQVTSNGLAWVSLT